MTYAALLRGINVGGNRKVEMKRLRTVFEAAGMADVRTYINSGNVIFTSPSTDIAALTETLRSAVEAEFGFPVEVLLRDAPTIQATLAELPDDWTNDDSAKCDVLFLWDEVDSPTVLDELTIKPGIDDVRYVPGALLWRVERPLVTRSGLLRIVGTPLYRQMTVRNCNTLRKIAALMRDAEDV